MVEKKIVVDNLRYSYNGVFDLTKFFKNVDQWMRSQEMEKELKKHLEEITPNGKNVEWTVELWKNPADWAKAVVRLRVLITNVVDVQVKKGDATRNLQQGNVLIIIDGFKETDIEGRWQQKPIFYFLRSLYDKFIWKTWTNKFDNVVYDGCYALQRHLQAFFKLYEY